MSLAALLLAPGFLQNGPVRTALAVGGVAAIVSAVVGVFTVIRGQSFAGHALADVSSAGGSASFLFSVSPMLGFLGMAALGAGALELLGVRRAPAAAPAPERDLITGIVLGAGLGLTALLLYFDISLRSTTGAAISVMFGSMFAIPPAIVPLTVGVGAAALALVALLYRPLLLSSVDPALAAVRGVAVRRIDLAFLLLLSLAVTLSAMTIGAILSTALLIGPAAAALRLTRRPGAALGLAVLFGLAATFGGILLAYDSYDWTPGRGWPVSFFIVTLVFLIYLATGLTRSNA